jgi:hypothetical protein
MRSGGRPTRVRFALKADKSLHRSEMTRCARNGLMRCNRVREIHGGKSAIALSCYAVERMGNDPLLSEPAVVDLFPGAVGTDGCKASIELGNDLRALALGHAERKRLLVEHDFGDGELVWI